jgi:hypothetical protein
MDLIMKNKVQNFISKKAHSASYEFPKRYFEDGLSDLERLNVVRGQSGTDHFQVVTTDYFKNNILNPKVLDRLPDGSIRSVKDGVVINGRVLTLFATLDVKKGGIYGGSAASWEALLVSLYLLCRPTEEGRKIRSKILEIFTRCFSTNIMESTFMKRLEVDSMLGKSKDIIITNQLLLNDYIIDYIKRFKQKIESGERPNIKKDINIIDTIYFRPLLESSISSEKEEITSQINDAKNTLEKIFKNISEAVFDKPKIISNPISEDFEKDMEIIASIVKMNDKSIFSSEDFFTVYKHLLPEKLSSFKSNYISDEEKINDIDIELEFEKLFKEELDKIADKNIVVSKQGDDKYSILALKDKVLESLAKLYKFLPTLEKKALIREIFKYSKG